MKPFDLQADSDPYGLIAEPLATGPVCWIFDDARSLPEPIPASGKQNFWDWNGQKAITLHPAWAWAVIYGGKWVENRNWTPKYRGRLAIHAGSNLKTDAEARAFLAAAGIDVPDEIPVGAVIGYVDLVDVARYPD